LRGGYRLDATKLITVFGNTSFFGFCNSNPSDQIKIVSCDDYRLAIGARITVLFSNSNLAEFINTQFGSYNYFGGDGITTFAVPDLRGEFLRCTGTNSHANNGNGSSVGIHQNGTMIPAFRSYSGGDLIAAVYNDNTSNRNYPIFEAMDYQYNDTTYIRIEANLTKKNSF
jgi:hypothetical protein